MKNETVKKLNLLILIKSIDGGTGTFLLNFLKIRKIFYNNKIKINTLVLERPTYRNVNAFKFEYFRSKNFYPQRYSFSLQNCTNFLEELFWLKNKINRDQFTVVIGVDLRCNLLVILLKLLFIQRIKVIVTNHIDLARTISDKSTKQVNFILKKIIGFFYNKADAVVCVSKELSQNLKNYFEIKNEMITIYNGMSEVNKIKDRRNNNQTKIIITIARLVEQKDHLTLIKAFSLLLRTLPNTQLWIASDGPKRKELEIFVNSLMLNQKIKFLGWIKNIDSYLKKADIFVLSSKREGFAYVLIEAMSYALPIISTDTPYGPKEILDNGKYGLLVPMENPVILKEAMEKILTNPTKYNYFAKKSFERSKFFSTKKMLDDYKRIIVNVL